MHSVCLGGQGCICYLLPYPTWAVKRAAHYLMDRKYIDALLRDAPPRTKIAPVPMDLNTEAGKRRVMSVAKRVIETHSAVLKSLATR